MQDNTEHFLQLWGAYFKFALGKNNGVGVWTAFINDDRCDYSTFCKAIEMYGKEYARRKDAGYPAEAPTFAQVKARYFSLKNQQKIAENQRRYGEGASTCGICFGSLRVFVLAPLSNDHERKNWPPDYRHVDPDLYRGVEVAPCPVCCGDKYPTFELRKQVENHSLPERVGAEHPARIPGFCDGSVVWGDALLKEYVERAARKKHPTLEEAFPL